MNGKKIGIKVRENKDASFETIQVNAIIIDRLAVTPCQGTWNRKHKDWTVTHIGSGYSVYRCINLQKDAIKLAEMLKDLDWKFTSPKSPKVKAMTPAVEKIIKKWFKERK